MKEISRVYAGVPTVALGEALTELHGEDHYRIQLGNAALRGTLDTEAAVVWYRTDPPVAQVGGVFLNQAFAPLESGIKLMADLDVTTAEVRQWVKARTWTRQEELCLYALTALSARVAAQEGLRTMAGAMLVSSRETQQRDTVFVVPQKVITNIMKDAINFPDYEGLNGVIIAAEKMADEFLDLPESKEFSHKALGMLLCSQLLPASSYFETTTLGLSIAHTTQMLDNLMGRPRDVS